MSFEDFELEDIQEHQKETYYLFRRKGKQNLGQIVFDFINDMYIRRDENNKFKGYRFDVHRIVKVDKVSIEKVKDHIEEYSFLTCFNEECEEDLRRMFIDLERRYIDELPSNQYFYRESIRSMIPRLTEELRSQTISRTYENGV